MLTFEPIHKLLERATQEYPEQRISIAECIELLQIQQKVIKEIDKKAPYIISLLFEERSKRTLQKIKPDIHVYEDKDQMLRIVSEILPYSNIVIMDRTGRRKLLQSTRAVIEIITANIWQLNLYIKGSIV